MKRQSATVTAAAAFILLCSQAASAESAQFRILCSNGIKGAMQTLVSEFERKSGAHVSIEYNATAVLKRQIQAGDDFDLAVLANPGVDELIKAGKIAAGTRTDIATAPLAAGIRSGAAKADIHTKEAIKARLLAAKSITFAKEGAATAAFVVMFQSLGITSELEPKIVRQTVTGRPAESVAEGQNEIVLAPVSEIIPIHGLQVLGLIPAEFQKPIVMAVGVGAKAHNPAAAKAFVAYVTSTAAAPILTATGMEPLKK